MPITEARINNIGFEINSSAQVGDILYLGFGRISTGGFTVFQNRIALGEITEIYTNTNKGSIGFNYTSVGLTATEIVAYSLGGNQPFDYFLSFKKHSAVNSNSLKGYYALGKFINDDFNNENELYAVNSQIAFSSK